MKKILLIILVLPFISLVSCKNAECIQNCNSSIDISTAPLSSREVLEEGLNVWKASYAQLVKDNVVGNSGKPDILTFPLSDLKQLHNRDSKNPNISFWFYMENDTIPKFALNNENNDSTDFLIIEGGRVVTKDSSYMNSKFNKWKAWCDSTKGSFVYVNYYRYEWDDLFNLVVTGTNNALTVENVAHTVNSDSQIYEVPKKKIDGVYVEGYVVLDIVLWGSKLSTIDRINSWKPSGKYDFAMPCPKACPSISSK